MGRQRRYVSMMFVVLLDTANAGCGGGGGGSGGSPPPPPPPPAQDFSITVSSNAVNLQQGATTSAFGVSVKGQNGFAGSVQVTLSGLPPGVQTNPSSPFSLVANSSAPVVLGAAVTCPNREERATLAIKTANALRNQARR